LTPGNQGTKVVVALLEELTSLYPTPEFIRSDFVPGLIP
jgi:hypothetical protein